ncbi:MAG: DNA modification methylase, partial [Pseudolysinimonas sp.]
MKVRAGAAAAIAALVMLGVAACAPIASLKPYDPSDGVSTTVGQVKVLNALVLSKSGEDGNLLFAAYNATDGL